MRTARSLSRHMAIAAAVTLLCLPPAVSAQGHEHSTGPVRIATDLNDDGLALVGHPAHFALVAFGEDEVPDFHQDLPVRVWFNDALLWEQTVITGHDYDGINAFSIAFPAPGTWRVEALADGEVITYRNGTVVPAGPDRADLAFEMSTTDDGHASFLYSIRDNGTRIDHVDAWLEIWRDGMIWFRTHTHTHDEDQAVELRLPDGDYVARVTGYVSFPTDNGPRFQPLVHSQAFSFSTAVPTLSLPAQDGPAPPAQRNTAVLGSNTSPYRLVGTYDPYSSVGIDTLQHLSAIVVDEHGDAVQHVDFEATLRGPGGVLFRSDTLHEYDGIYDLATRQPVPGTYWLDLTASRGQWSDSIQMPYAVLPPALANVAGPQIVTFEGSLAAGTAGDLWLAAANPAGVPFAHGEMEVQVRGDPGMPALVHAKLHTHGDGAFPFRLALAQAGQHELVVTPFPLDPQPVLGYHRDSLGTPLGFSLDVAPGPGFRVADAPVESVADDAEAPGFTPALGLFALVSLAALALRRK